VEYFNENHEFELGQNFFLLFLVLMLGQVLNSGVEIQAQSTSESQTISWVSPKFVYALDDQWSFAARPLQRFNFTEEEHLDFFQEFQISKKLGNGFSASILPRYWAEPNGRADQMTVFYDINHSFNRSKFKFTNKLRFHWGINWQADLADFLRWQPIIGYHFHKKAHAFIATDWFFQFNGINEMRRVRYQLGYFFRCDKRTALSFEYWREESLGVEPKIISNIFVLTLIQNFSRKKKRE